MLPQKSQPGPGGQGSCRALLCRFGFGQGGVEAEQRREMVGFRRRDVAQCPPEARHPVGGLAAQHPLGPEIHRGVGRQLKYERVGVVGWGGARRQAEGGGHPLVLRPGPFADHGQRPEQFGRRHGAPTRSTSRKASLTGLSGRISQ